MAMQLRGMVVALSLLGFLGGAGAQSGKKNAPPPAEKMDAPALTKVIDREIQARLDAEGIKPSPLSDDSEFLRRVYLDLIGVIPPADKVVAFLDSFEPSK